MPASFEKTRLPPASFFVQREREIDIYIYIYIGGMFRQKEACDHEEQEAKRARHQNNIGALIIRIGFWGLLYSKYNKEPLK